MEYMEQKMDELIEAGLHMATDAADGESRYSDNWTTDDELAETEGLL